MKKIIILFSVLVFAQLTGKAQIAFKSGNAELDADLNNINVNAKLDLGKFKADLSLNYDVSGPKIDALFSLNMEPAEVYMALEIGAITGKPTDEVVNVYKAKKDKGWGVIAKELGIKPGSAEFHALKNKTKGKTGKGKKDKSEKTNGNGKGKGKGKKD